MALTQVSTQGIKDGTITGSDLATSFATTGDFTLTGANYNVLWDKSDSALEFADNAQALFGTGADLRIYHNGTHSFIQDAGTGNLEISSSKVAINNAANNANMGTFTDGGAVALYHNGSKKFETTSDGVKISGAEGVEAILTFEPDEGDNASDKFRFRASDSAGFFLENGSSNETSIKANFNGSVELYHDNSKKFETTSTGITVTGAITSTGAVNGSTLIGTNISASSNINLNSDSGKLSIGVDSDLQLFHNGSNSYIQDNGTGALLIGSNGGGVFIRGQHGEESIIANSNGSVDLYYDNSKKFETTSSGATVSGELTVNSHLLMGDGDKLRLGDSNDLELHHSGGENYIQGHLNQLYIRSAQGIYIQPNTNENGVVALKNGAVELYYDNSKKLYTNTSGIVVQGDVFLADSNKFIAGNSSDLQIFHDGTDSKIYNSSATPLKIQNVGSNGATVHIQARPDEEGIKLLNNSGASKVELYYDNSKVLETTASGVDVQGHITLAASNNAPKITFDENGADDPKAEIQMDQVDGTNGQLIFKTEGGGTLSERMRIESNGDFEFDGIGTATPGNGNSTTGMGFEPRNGTIFTSRSDGACIRANVNTNDVNIVSFANNGTVRGRVFMQTTTVSYATSSDYRLKENEVAISDGITRLKTLKPYRFNFIEDPSKTVDGFFAHEVTAVPEAVSGTKDEVDKNGDPVHQGLDYGRITPLLTAALQEAVAKIEVLETEVAALKAS